ncbi:MAG: glycosyltransferase, partial [Nitrososphaerales archaeon]
MKILQVIHGYPMRYNAGSEVYTQTLCQALSRRGHEVSVFCRKEDPFRPDYEITTDVDSKEPSIRLSLVNMPSSRDRYQHEEVDRHFGSLLDEMRPEIVHVQHLNHLSTSIVREAANRNVPIVYTLHDYWLMCPRGQFVQFGLGSGESWKLCDGQDDRKCAVSCYSRYFTGEELSKEYDIDYWTSWVHDRMNHIGEMANLVDTFIAPSEYLLRKFRDEFGIPDKKIKYLDYGFDLTRLAGRQRERESEFVFGYIGTHTPQKGIDLLVEAFGKLKGEARLRIWGRSNGQITTALREKASKLPGECSSRIELLPEYQNLEIVPEVFNKVDAIVVPSIWLENSPLVIHEAQQARVPVITADLGGLSEYVHHEQN